MDIDYLIVGQGLAGSLLGWELTRRGQRILLLDNGETNASQVAAGLINPVTGRRFVKTVHVDMLLPEARRFYADLESFFKQAFFIDMPMLRLLQSDAERETAERRLTDPDYRNYLENILESLPGIRSSHGIVKQSQTGYLLTRPLLAALRRFFVERGAYLQDNLDYSDIRLEPELRWRDRRPHRIIFCEGYRAMHNPWFGRLPFQPVKGEILTGACRGEPARHILNYGHWFIPLAGGQFKTGATFERDRLDCAATPQARAELLAALHRIKPTLTDATIMHQEAGIRPATQDRQPFVGFHPRFPKLAIFNGFGAKGSLQIPYSCLRFTDTLIDRAPLPDNLTIERHYDSHFPA